jgi:hypothetical protein
MNWDIELSREYLQVFKRRRIDATFDQAEEVHRDAKQLGEFFLAHLSSRADGSKSIAELFAQTRQIKFHLSADFRSHLSCVPPNEITGSFEDPISEPACAT